MGAAIAVTLALIISITLNVVLFMRGKNPSMNHNRSIRSTILSGIENVSELATIRETFQSIVTFEDGKKIPFINMNFPGTTRKFMMKYSGTVVCGADLSKAQVSEPYSSNKIRITLPRSEVLDVYADVHSFEVYPRSRFGSGKSKKTFSPERHFIPRGRERHKNSKFSSVISGNGSRDSFH